MRDAAEIERAIVAFARTPNGGLIVTGSSLATFHRDLIITLAARHKLPAVYSSRFYVADGGLICYGLDLVDQHRRAAAYVDRILKGEKPADLPVLQSTKFHGSSSTRKTTGIARLGVVSSLARPTGNLTGFNLSGDRSP